MKHVKAHLAVFIFLTIFSITASAQFGMGRIEEIEEVKKRKLIVMIEEPREQMLKALGKKSKLGNVEDYKTDLALYNATMKAVVEKFWPYNKEGIQYMTIGEIEKLGDTKTKEYAVLFCVSTQPKASSAGYKNYQGLYWTKDMRDEFTMKNMLFTSMVINIIEDFGKMPVFSVPVYDVFPSKASLVFGIRNIAGYFDTRADMKKGKSATDELAKMQELITTRAPLLAQRTLLIRSEWLDKELNEENLKKYYPYPYKFVGREELDEAVMNQDAAFAYAVILPQVVSSSYANTVTFMKFVIDAGDNGPMAAAQAGALGVGVGMRAASRDFTGESFAQITSQVKGGSKK